MGNTFSRWRNYLETGYTAIQQGIESNAETFKPGTPTTAADKRVDCIVLEWKKPESLYPNYRYQIRYKCITEQNWHFHDEQPKEEAITVNNLRPKTKYTFQVRMVNTEIEGPYSHASEETETLETAAIRYLEMTYVVKDSGESPSLRCILMKEIRQSLDEANKIKKFEFGTPDMNSELEKTIILLGSEGTGKRTFIDGLINYSLAVHWDDPHRFTITHPDTGTHQDGWTTFYVINPLHGSRLNFRLNIIDTPSFSTDDEERCKDILGQLQYLYTKKEGNIEFVDAICFLVRAPDTQLSKAQINTFRSVLTSMGTDIEENICLITTFADCKQPTIIPVLNQADVPTGNLFPINNAGLFIQNTGSEMHPLSPLFWKIGQECFKTFLEHLSKLPRKAPMPVLPDRHEIEDKIEDLQPLLVTGLDEIVQLKDEKKIIEHNQEEIEANKTYTYSVTERKLKRSDLPPGRHVTNCLNCYVTCHPECNIPRNEDKHGCWAMDKATGHCTQCFEKCHWSSHANTPYIYEYVEEIVTRSYVEKENKYRRHIGEEMTVTKVLDRMGDHRKDLDRRIQKKMDEIRGNINLLRRISNRHDTMTLHDQLDLLIQSEGKKRQTDYEKRIEVLMELRKM